MSRRTLLPSSRARTRTRAGAAVAMLGVASLLGGCVDLGGSTETTDTTKARTSTSTTPKVSIASGPRPPKMLPGGVFAAPTSLEGVGLRLTEIGKIEAPTGFTTRPGYPNLYLTERNGHVRQLTVDIQYDNDGNVRHTGYYVERGYVLDIARDVSTQGERGMLGIAFSSDGRTIFVSYTDRDGRLRVSSWKVGDYSVDYDTRKDLLTIDHPREERIGGGLVMGPDGFLYIGTGDGGGLGDPDQNAQNTHSLLGKILRIDPGGGLGNFPYGIPDTNPFRDGVDGAPEVWSYGLANPWRFTFDRITRDLWIADVGALDIEEIDFAPVDGNGLAARGANFGWNKMQGSRPTGDETPDDAVGPVFEYAKGADCAVVGGALYRGLAVPGMAGAYIYGDFCSGQIRGLITDGGSVLDHRELGISVPPNTLSAFGETNDGEIWVLSLDGRIFRIDPA